MKNINTFVLSSIMLCVTACSSGSLYFPEPNIDTTKMPLSPAASPGPDAGTADPNAGTDIGPAQAPAFAPTIDGNAFTPQAVFFATGQDPQNHPVLMLVVSDQNDLCDQITQGHALLPGAGALAMYLYNVDTGSGGPEISMPATYAGTYAVFNSSVPGADVTGQPTLHIPMDTGRYASGTIFTWDKLCTKAHAHQVSEGSVTLQALDGSGAKAAGTIAVLLDNNVALKDAGRFVAQACPALLTLSQATGCMLP